MSKRYLPIIIFVLFSFILLGTTIFYSPSWGLMDDAQLLMGYPSIWMSANVVESIFGVINHNVYFMPFSVIWRLITYHALSNFPLVCYIIIIIQNMFGVFLWGVILHRLFNEKKTEALLNIFLFPLSLFFFTPFWNIFNYISLQEKFIFLFSALSIYFVKRYLDIEKVRFLLWGVIFTVFAILSKPTGIYLVLSYIVYSYVSILMKGRSRGAASILVVNVCLLVSFILVTIGYKGNGYADRYNLNLMNMVNNFMNTPSVIKLLTIFSVFMIFYIIHKVKRRYIFSLEALFIPLGFLSYIFVHLPWGIVSYHISAVAPFAVGIFFPSYSYLNRRSYFSRVAVNLLILLVLFSTFLYVIKPRISRLADVKKTAVYLKDLSKAQTGRYFFPPPFEESSYSMSVYSGVPIKYLSEGILSSGMLRDDIKNYIIFDNQDTSIDLIGVQVDNEVYKNDNWRVYEVKRANVSKARFTAKFKKNIVDKVKDYLKK